MNTKDKPKQFLMIHGKPIIVHTIEKFQYHKSIDGIIVVCISDWLDYMEDLKYRYRLDKIGKIVPGGKSGQMSIYNGLSAAAEVYGQEGNIVLIHDGVRPLIDDALIDENIRSVREFGSAITVNLAKETVILVDDDGLVTDVPSRAHSRTAQAPQSFWLTDILSVQKEAIAKGITDAIDSCSLMRMFDKKVSVVVGPNYNIKITTPEDFYVFRALYDALENEQLNL